MRRVSRRAFLAGGAAIAASGVAVGLAATQPRGRRLLHRFGLFETTVVAAPRSTDVQVRRDELANGRRMAWARTGDDPQPLAIVVCLHGRGGDEMVAFEGLRLHDTAVALGLDLLLASVDGGSSYWHRRQSGDDSMGEIVRDLVPRLDDVAGLPTLGRAVLGWSMGGFGALAAVIEHPTVFSTAAVAGAALWRRFDETAPGAFDSTADFEAHTVFDRVTALHGKRVRIDCGEDDPFVATNRRLLAALPDAAGGIRPGFHDDAFWRLVAPDQLRFIAAMGPP